MPCDQAEKYLLGADSKMGVDHVKNLNAITPAAIRMTAAAEKARLPANVATKK